MADVLAVWPEAVGTMVAANAWPARIARDGTLHVNTSSSAWAFELGQLAPAILERLSEKLGERAPASLRFAVGHLPEPSSEELGEARTDVPEPGRYVELALPFTVPRPAVLEFPCAYRGGVGVWFDRLRIERVESPA